MYPEKMLMQEQSDYNYGKEIVNRRTFNQKFSRGRPNQDSI